MNHEHIIKAYETTDFKPNQFASLNYISDLNNSETCGCSHPATGLDPERKCDPLGASTVRDNLVCCDGLNINTNSNYCSYNLDCDDNCLKHHTPEDCKADSKCTIVNYDSAGSMFR